MLGEHRSIAGIVHLANHDGAMVSQHSDRTGEHIALSTFNADLDQVRRRETTGGETVYGADCNRGGDACCCIAIGHDPARERATTAIERRRQTRLFSSSSKVSTLAPAFAASTEKTPILAPTS